MKRIFLSFLIFSLALAAFFVGKGILVPLEPDPPFEKEFVIPRGIGVRDIALNLEQEGLIKNRFSFLFYLFLKGEIKNVKAGQYLFSSSMSIPEISRKLVAGETIKEKITIIEGWTKKDIASYLEKKDLCSQQEFFELGKEGFLFPDTYFVEKGTSCEQFLEQISSNFETKLTPELRTEIEKQKKKIFEIIIMASLIEKEVRTFEDKKIVSGILWKRRDYDMPLQIDATITFITGKKTTKVSKQETEIDSPYNTYKYKGLPIGPICNPGLESIKAAIYPEGSEYWYYLSTPEGETIFSKTLEEHNIAKAKYLK